VSKVEVQGNKRRRQGVPQCSLFIIFGASLLYLITEGGKNVKLDKNRRPYLKYRKNATSKRATERIKRK
jgi:hypothetical protein